MKIKVKIFDKEVKSIQTKEIALNAYSVGLTTLNCLLKISWEISVQSEFVNCSVCSSLCQLFHFAIKYILIKLSALPLSLKRTHTQTQAPTQTNNAAPSGALATAATLTKATTTFVSLTKTTNSCTNNKQQSTSNNQQCTVNAVNTVPFPPSS